MSGIKLVIFDMDETLVMTRNIWRAAANRLYEKINQPFSYEVAQKYQGMNALDVGRTIYDHFRPDCLSAEDCGKMLRGWLIEEFNSEITTMPGAHELLSRLSGRYTSVIASGSPIPAIQSVVERFNWSNLLQGIVSSEEVNRGKPYPDVFIEAAQRMGVPADECLVVEDSLHGVNAAIAAGMACFVVPSSDDPAIVRQSTKTFRSLDEIELDTIRSINK